MTNLNEDTLAEQPFWIGKRKGEEMIEKGGEDSDT